MGYLIITEEKKDKMSDLCKDMLRAGGKLMQCLEGLEEESMGSRIGYREFDPDEIGYRDNMGYRDEVWSDPRMGMRRGVRGTGRYSRY